MCIINDFTEFNAIESGWILERVELISIHITRYQPTYPNYKEQEKEDDEDQEADGNLSGNI